MPPKQVDFYLLENTTSYWQAICRLLEKAYQHQIPAFVWCSTQEDAIHLDELLWTFKPESFIPHGLTDEVDSIKAIPIRIGTQQVYTPLLLNLTIHIPEMNHSLERILEVVPNDETSKAISREHYRHYRSLGYILNTHSI